MTLEEIQATLDQLVVAMLAKGVVTPRTEFHVTSDNPLPYSAFLWCSVETKCLGGEYLSGFSRYATPEAALDAARSCIDALPDPDTKVMRTYLGKLADAADYATEHSIADEFVDPVRLTLKAMSDNLLPPPVIEVAQ